MKLRLAYLCLALLAAPAVADLAEARSCGARSNRLALASVDESATGQRAARSLPFTIGAAFPL